MPNITKETQIRRATVTIVAVDNEPTRTSPSNPDQRGYAPRVVCHEVTPKAAASLLKTFLLIMYDKDADYAALLEGLRNTIRSTVETPKYGPQPMYGWTEKTNGKASLWLTVQY